MTILLWARFLLLASIAGLVVLYVMAALPRHE
jgi:uncharacterized membrane protein YqjE